MRGPGIATEAPAAAAEVAAAAGAVVGRALAAVQRHRDRTAAFCRGAAHARRCLAYAARAWLLPHRAGFTGTLTIRVNVQAGVVRSATLDAPEHVSLDKEV